MKNFFVVVILICLTISMQGQSNKQILDFEFDDFVLNGVLNLPASTPPKGIVLIVHGSGQTNAVAQNWYADIRFAILQAGYGTYMWDKMGCGNSEGTFDQNQSVQHSAQEVIAAINMLKNEEVPGSERIGLWGISRAGWINPLVIDQYPDIAFWISVSGVDDDETFKYLLAENLRIDGYPPDTVSQIVEEWHQGVLLSRSGGDYSAYLAATPMLQNNAFWIRITNGGLEEKAYNDYQQILKEADLDEVSMLPLYVTDFETLLARINIPVLALFGEKDMHVNWTQTKALYDRTLAPNTSLTVRTFPNCNHNLFQCETGGVYEFEDHDLASIRCENVLASITAWLKEQ